MRNDRQALSKSEGSIALLRALQGEEEGEGGVGRPTQTLGCNPFTGQEFFTTDLRVTYEIETAQPIQDDLTTSTFAEKLPLLVQGAAVEALHHTLCAVGLDESTGRKPNTVVRLAKCMYSITRSQQGELTYCSDPSVVNCVALSGDLKLFHAADCADDIELAALLALEQDVQEPDFIQSMNSRLAGFDNNVTRVAAMENVSDSGPAAATASYAANVSTNRKISPGGFILIALAGAVLLVLFALLLVQQRQRRRARRALDDKSVKTDMSNPEEGSYLTVDYGNLAKQHSKNDVHKCASALCPLCLNNPGDVQMVTVPKVQKTVKKQPEFVSSYMEDDEDEYYHHHDINNNDECTEEGIEAIAQEEVPVEIGLRRARRFKIFRKKRPTVSLESVSFVRVASAQRFEREANSHAQFSVEL